MTDGIIRLEVTQPVPGDGNLILSAIPDGERARLLPLMSSVTVKRGQIIQEQGKPLQQVAFVERGAFALVLRTPSSGKTKGTGLVGREGFAGTSAFLHEAPLAAHTAFAVDDCRVRVIAVEAVRREIAERSALYRLCLSYIHTRMNQSLMLASCGYSLTERLACWLLLLSEWLGTDRLRITQRELAHVILGTRRAGVTIAAHTLKDAGAIDLQRKGVVIKDRDRLRGLACGCYPDVSRRWEPAGATDSEALPQVPLGSLDACLSGAAHL